MNVYDYLKWRGDLNFENAPFNEVDNICLSYIAYTKLDPYIKKDESIGIKEAADRFFAHHSEEEVMMSKSFCAQAPILLREMAKTRRFGNAVIHDFVSIMNHKTTEQFCAFQIDLDKDNTYVTFRGTDDSLLGWKEDFALSYTTTSSQKSAAAYLKERCRFDHLYYVGGHSKGGNLAAYACLNNPSLYPSIITCFSNDGPGLNERFMSEEAKENFEYFQYKYVKFIPEMDVFGTIFENERHHIIIKSDGLSVMQHDLLSWQVEGDHFVYGEKNTYSSLAIKEGIKEFLTTVSEADCKKFSNELFKALKDAGLTTITEIAHGSLPVFVRILMEFSEMNETAREVSSKFVGILLKSSGSGIVDSASAYLNDVVKDIKELFTGNDE